MHESGSVRLLVRVCVCLCDVCTCLTYVRLYTREIVVVCVHQHEAVECTEVSTCAYVCVVRAWGTYLCCTKVNVCVKA